MTVARDGAGVIAKPAVSARRLTGSLAKIAPVLRATLPARLLQKASSYLSDGPGHAQRAVHTALDRYPEVFAAAANFGRTMLADGDTRPLRILSFGCSTGEECFSLRQYFPDAAIYGCDINKAVLAIAAGRQRHGGITFFHSSSQTLAEHGPFDIVFCMSSLCLFPEADRPSGENGTFPFSAFDNLVSEIDRNLRPGGLLVVYNASYPFKLSRVATHYDVVEADVVVENGFVNKLHRGGRAFTVTVSKDHSRCHRMVSDPQDYQDSDFVDCLFRKRDGLPHAMSLTLSPTLSLASQVLCSYTLSDDDVFRGVPGLLATTYDIELVREPGGTMFERITYSRSSVTGGGSASRRRFVRPVGLLW
jgi:SAM-dependent methyltransferase